MILNTKSAIRRKLQDIFSLHQIKHITSDSREVRSNNSAFFAIPGTKHNGEDYINSISNTDQVIFTQNPDIANDKNIYYVENIRLAFAIAAGILHPNYPKIIAVTGTNGKSSVVSYIQQILSLLGRKSASVGTLGVKSNIALREDHIISNSLTTSDPLTLRSNLEQLHQQGIEYVALEASSHGLDQDRLGDLELCGAGFTNISQDHLEYHGSMSTYLQAKLKIFDHLATGAKAVINDNITQYDSIIAKLKASEISYSSIGNGEIKFLSLEPNIDGQKICLSWNGQEYQFTTPIIGSFQAYNILMAAKLVDNLGIATINEIIATLPQLVSVSGRLERITEKGDDYQVFVDYAHTPDALEKSLAELDALKKDGSLIVIFGCGGDRDPTKRSIMGEIANKIADKVIITDDNPRTEDAAKIRQQVMSTAPKAQEIGDRRKAILQIVASLKKNDILLIAGKGHEDYQIIGTEKIHLSDAEIVKIGLKNNGLDR